MSLLICDQCKKVLVDPVCVPCGYNICQAHVTSSTHSSACSFCQRVHADPYVSNQKLARLIGMLDRAKAAVGELDRNARSYELLKLRPLDFIRAQFDELRQTIADERDRLLESLRARINDESARCLVQVDQWKEACVSSLEVKPTTEFFAELNEVKARLAKFNEFLYSERISEDVWEEIVQQTKRINEDVINKQ